MISFQLEPQKRNEENNQPKNNVNLKSWPMNITEIKQNKTKEQQKVMTYEYCTKDLKQNLRISI